MANDNARARKAIMDRDKILILGGYGHSGTHASSELYHTTHHTITIAGRSRDKARGLAKSLGSRAEGIVVDPECRKSLLEAMSDARLVINCFKPSRGPNRQIAETALESRCHYVDISNYDELKGILNGRERQIFRNELVWCTSAGILPGLTSILARYLAEMLDSIDRMSIFFLFQESLTQTSSVADTESLLSGDIGLYRKGRWKKPWPTDIKRVSFFHPFGERVCLPIKIYDMAGLPEKYAIKSFETYGTYGSTSSLRMLLISVLCWMNRKARLKAISSAGASSRRKNGTDDVRGFAIQAHATGIKHRKRTRLVLEATHNNSHKATGIAAATAARMILNGTLCVPGISQLVDCLDDPIPFVRDISDRGLTCKVNHFL
jgi:saccharopine dehydrogenase-like NADP-dependent oxidoreductase